MSILSNHPDNVKLRELITHLQRPPHESHEQRDILLPLDEIDKLSSLEQANIYGALVLWYKVNPAGSALHANVDLIAQKIKDIPGFYDKVDGVAFKDTTAFREYEDDWWWCENAFPFPQIGVSAAIRLAFSEYHTPALFKFPMLEKYYPSTETLSKVSYIDKVCLVFDQRAYKRWFAVPSYNPLDQEFYGNNQHHKLFTLNYLNDIKKIFKAGYFRSVLCSAFTLFRTCGGRFDVHGAGNYLAEAILVIPPAELSDFDDEIISSCIKLCINLGHVEAAKVVIDEMKRRSSTRGKYYREEPSSSDLHDVSMDEDLLYAMRVSFKKSELGEETVKLIDDLNEMSANTIGRVQRTPESLDPLIVWGVCCLATHSPEFTVETTIKPCRSPKVDAIQNSKEHLFAAIEIERTAVANCRNSGTKSDAKELSQCIISECSEDVIKELLENRRYSRAGLVRVGSEILAVGEFDWRELLDEVEREEECTCIKIFNIDYYDRENQTHTQSVKCIKINFSTIGRKALSLIPHLTPYGRVASIFRGRAPIGSRPDHTIIRKLWKEFLHKYGLLLPDAEKEQH